MGNDKSTMTDKVFDSRKQNTDIRSVAADVRLVLKGSRGLCVEDRDEVEREKTLNWTMPTRFSLQSVYYGGSTFHVHQPFRSYSSSRSSLVW